MTKLIYFCEFCHGHIDIFLLVWVSSLINVSFHFHGDLIH